MGDDVKNLDEQVTKEQIGVVEQQINEVREEIKEVEQQIKEAEEQIKEVEEQIRTCLDSEGRAQLRNKEAQLRNEEVQLRNEKARKEAFLEALLVEQIQRGRGGFSPPKRPRIAGPSIQSFAESAAKHYRQWEQAQKVGVENGGHKNFLLLSNHPYYGYPGGFVVWIRKCYQDLKEILTKAKASEKFVLLGTEGIGKSLFTYFWICYRATLKEKVAWKPSGKEWYLLDFSKEGSSSAQVFSQMDSELLVVLDDPNAWLIIDEPQPGRLYFSCHILVTCSAKKENYKEFSKSRMVSTRYIPVWSKEELNEFLDDFEALKVNYSHMDVPTKVQAIEAFGKLGGVPWYVLNPARTAKGIRRAEGAFFYFKMSTCSKLFSVMFEEYEWSGSLVHMKCRDESYEMESMFPVFASPYVQDEFGKCFARLSKVDVVDFLRDYAYEDAGSVYGYIFEMVAHQLMQRGGEFPMKRVGSNGVALRDTQAEAETALPLPGGMRVVEFAEVKELASMSPNTYYKPLSPTFESVDAVIYPNILLQFFSSRRGIHGYKVNELKALHGQLKQTEYKLCSCVPEDKYQITGFQNWLKADKTKYSKPDTTLELMDQYVVQVDYNKYHS